MPKIDIGYIKKELPASIGKIGWALFAAGVILGIIAYFIDPTRTSFSYLVSYAFLVSIAIGSLLLVAIEYAAGAVWSVPFRRISEFFSAPIPLLILFAIPLLFSLHNYFHWTHAPGDEILQGKSTYLNVPFLIIRLAVTLILWLFFYWLIIKNSQKQDTIEDQKLTSRNIRLSFGFIVCFAITITIFSVDWVMSLEPHWYSTMFGVYFFSGTAWVALAVLTLVAVILKEKGYLPAAVTKDHFYSLGTLLFAFTIFWAYIAFSQYMLIWYGDVPEETSWFVHRWQGGWTVVSVILVIAHFIVPFFALLSLPSKTNFGRLKFISVWIIAAHFIDVYWLIMPGMKIGEGAYFFSWSDLVFPLAVIGLIMLMFNSFAKKYNLIPIGDPKLKRSVNFHL